MPTLTRREHLLGLLESALAGNPVVIRCTSREYATQLRWTLYKLKQRHLGARGAGLSFSLIPGIVTCDLTITWNPPGSGILDVQPLETEPT